MTTHQRCDLTRWALDWSRDMHGPPPRFAVAVETPDDGPLIVRVFYRGQTMSLTFYRPVTHAELDGTLNMIDWGLRHAAGEITAAELRAALGLPAGLVGVVPEPMEASRA